MKRTPMPRSRGPMLRRRRIRRQSKRALTFEAELALRIPELRARSRGECELRAAPGCAGRAEHAHHRKLRSQGGTNDLDCLLAACFTCHEYAHHHPAEAYRHGWLVHRDADPTTVPVTRGIAV